MITLLLFGGSILLWLVVHWFKRARRARTNAYDRFLMDRQIVEVRPEDLRTHNLRMARHGTKSGSAEEQATNQNAEIPKKAE